ncbi:hypothetical protein FE773_02835 [Caminibacter mediatlanticus TB-2]|uniref:Uncharacterized protein n=1 Tax=Caminibacter mediatlanticus TB-2 TaxID=391592 RepID=A0AAI9AG66_9BACT|nr:hypothetical protein [Caminibacter mediatlanticus]EDM23026.1 hypothetical protein CMTB2_08610 [Caminibacter mediatlanticus TB-2]QCT94147.1 hypothetical protein FE773_02835 [Caminibacter mediatlanticus TB-2]
MIKKIILYLTLLTNSFAFYVGVGSFSACQSKFGSMYYKNCNFTKRQPIFSFLKKETPNVNAISMWITKDWKENWYPSETINKAIKNGYIPIFIFYWFGDDISPKFVKQHKEEYFDTLIKFSKFLKKINGPVIVILNPEYNENGMEKSKYFDLLQAKSILLIKQYKPNSKVGICLGDFGDYKKIWDTYNWNLNLPSLNYSAKLSDFIAFQEMRALTKNSYEEVLNTPYRALAFATYLNKKFNKPTFLAYLAISSYNNEKLQAKVYSIFNKLLPIFKNSANLIGINIFNYIDVPTHTGYFNIAEKYWGIKKQNGEKKEAFYEFLKFK